MYITKHWKRYLDDCFIVWNSGNNNLSVFKDILNELNPDIKFTADESLNRISFLDILLTKQDEVIMTDVYYKRILISIYTSTHVIHENEKSNTV